MPFVKYVRVVGFWEALRSYLIFPFWLIWHHAYFIPKVRKMAIDKYCGGDAALFKEEMLERYAQECLAEEYDLSANN